MNNQTTISKKLLQELIDNAATAMRVSPITTPEQKAAFLALSKSMDDVVRAVTQITAGTQSFAGTENGTFTVDSTKSSFI